MANQFSGLKRVGYADTQGGAVTYITGKISSDSTLEPEVTEQEITDGVLFGGGSISGEVMFIDHADYSTLEGFMTGNTEKWWTFEYNDGTSLETARAFNVFVRKMGGVNARDGLTPWAMSFQSFHTAPII